MQNSDGSFNGDYTGEADTRFTYCAVSCLSLLGKLNLINVESAKKYVLSCLNKDGAFGGMPGAESHAAYVFTAIATL